ncbi:hypothetical protein H4582DRAFT_2064501 [Lactarius indigo]|nr:hypothetical protein H4582DRAFT_2064501 [Lactarius indigo]
MTLSQYPVHTTQTLNAMDNALCQFHENKDVFVELGVWEHFNLPKLHSLLHYTRSITHFGSTDNYNTEYSERLHIDVAKNAYRMTNFKDEYKQMTTWLECQEAMHQHTAFIEWCKCGHSALSTRLVSVFHRVKFTNWDDTDQKTVDVLHIRREACNQYGDTIPGRFDTVLVKHRNRFGVAQICVVFQLARSGLSSIFLSSRAAAPTDLAYVEWFSPLSTPNECHGMYRISRSYQNNCHLASIIPLAEVCRSVQLYQAFGAVILNGAI